MPDPSIVIVDPRLRQLYQYWLEKKGDRVAPGRPDIAPEEIADVLPWVFLMEKVGERLRYRLVGDGFRQIYGSKLIGMFMDEIDLDHITAAYIGEYARSETEKIPIARKWEFTKLDGRYCEYERIILPLSPDGTIVNMFLCGAVGFGYG